MKYIFMFVPIGAIWLLSAWENGLVGGIGLLLSFLMALVFPICQHIADRKDEKGSRNAPTECTFWEEEQPPARAITRQRSVE